MSAKNLNLKNGEIYEYAVAINSNFIDTELNLPVKVNFYLQKNLKNFVEMGQEIEKARLDICAKYGTMNEEQTAYNFEENVIPQVTKEIQELFELVQEVKVYMISIDSFENVELTSKQLNAISFMIDEEE